MVAGHVGKTIDGILSDLKPIADAGFLADQRAQFLDDC
jgi:hypothetical protein